MIDTIPGHLPKHHHGSARLRHACGGSGCGRDTRVDRRGGVTGFLTPPDDADAMAARIVRLLEGEGLRQKMNGQAEEYVELVSTHYYQMMDNMQ